MLIKLIQNLKVQNIWLMHLSFMKNSELNWGFTSVFVMDYALKNKLVGNKPIHLGKLSKCLDVSSL